MGHVIHTSALTAELVELITAYSPTNNAVLFRTCKETALRDLRHHRFGRTNQFNVRSSLNGLVEKFQVLNHDPLADALQRCLDELETKSYRWKPDVLSLLLRLSHKPVEKTQIENREALELPETPPASTWDEILSEDPLPEDSLWDDVDYEARFSEEENSLEGTALSDRVGDSINSTTSSNDNPSSAEEFVMPIDSTFLSYVKEAQRRRSDKSEVGNITITELQTVRETLHMLQGLSSSLFDVNEQDHVVTARPQYYIQYASRTTISDLLSALAALGTEVERLRMFCQGVHHIPLLQTFAASVYGKIRSFEKMIAGIEKRFVGSKDSQIVSLLNVLAEVSVHSPLIRVLNEVISDLDGLPDDHLLRLLDDLYDRTSMAQVLGDNEQFEELGSIFFQCLQTYMRMIRKWMEAGVLDSEDILFPFTSKAHDTLATLWRDGYSLLYIDGELKGPRFLRTALPKIFASGKSVAFLKALGLENSLPEDTTSPEPLLTFENICRSTSTMSLLSFPDRLDQALQDWIQSKHRHSWTVVREYLERENGLWSTIDALEHLYLSRNGAMMQAFADILFGRLDVGRVGWADHYIVEDLARQTLGMDMHVDAASIFAVPDSISRGSAQYTVKALSKIAVNYHYPWPIENIIPPTTLPTYQRIFTLLLQIHRAKSRISQQRLLLIPTTHPHQHPSKTLGIEPTEFNSHPTAHAHHLRHRLLWLTTSLESYIFTTAILPCSEHLRTSTLTATDFDALIAAHAHFIATLEKRCLLTPELTSVHGALLSLLDLAVLFADIQQRQQRQQRHQQHPLPTPTLQESDTLQQGQGESSADRTEHSSDVELPSEEKAELEMGKREPPSASTTVGMETAAAEGGLGYVDRLRQIRGQYARLLVVVVAGLRSAGRAPGADGAWETLAEVLEWGVGGG